MRLEKLTSRLHQALVEAQALAARHDNTLIEPVHLLKALVDQSGGTTRPLLVRSGVNVSHLDEQLHAGIDRLARVNGQTSPSAMTLRVFSTWRTNCPNTVAIPMSPANGSYWRR